MRFATYRQDDGERFGLVLRDSRDGRDWDWIDNHTVDTMTSGEQ